MDADACLFQVVWSTTVIRKISTYFKVYKFHTALCFVLFHVVVRWPSLLIVWTYYSIDNASFENLYEAQNGEPDVYTQIHSFSQNHKSKANEPRHDKMCLREFSTRPDTNRPAQLQKLARVLKFRL